MCGIAGLLGPGARDRALVERLAARIAHRGPDDQGCWMDDDAGIALAHRRLAIVDLSPQGHQPMIDASGRFVLSYNGEIYNHQAIRRELDSREKAPAGGWRGHSDTETLLQAIAALGLERALSRCAGMFAFALWDRQERVLRLVRDRFGEKPLYYGWAGRDFIFGSELKALRAHPQANWPINRTAVRTLASRTYIPAPLSIYEGVFKLEPGCILTVDAAGVACPRIAPPSVEKATEEGVRVDCYWSYRQVVQDGLARPLSDEASALAALEQSLEQAVAGQAVADVPVGAFLSGGIDSSTVCAFYQRVSARPIRTFSIGFEEDGFNEADHARAVARHLGTVHDERIVTAQDARDVIPLIPELYDEPFADSSQIPTYLVSRFAREQVTVALTGDGADELFGGYNRHVLAPALWNKLRHIPSALRSLGRPIAALPIGLWGPLVRHGPRLHGVQRIAKALRTATTARSADDVYLSFLDEWRFSASPVVGGDNQPGFDMDVSGGPDAVRMMYCDAVSYLPDDILCKVDRASMAVGLEARVPFLDHRVAEVAARMPIHWKIHRGTGKHVLRELLYRQAPRHLFDRPKAGFAVPVGEWLRGPLRDWAEDLLEPRALAAEGWFDEPTVTRRWQDHLTRRQDSTPAIWAVLMFQAWLRRNEGVSKG